MAAALKSQRRRGEKLLIFQSEDMSQFLRIYFLQVSLFLSRCLLHSGVSNGKQSVDVVLGNMSRTRHKGGERKGGGREVKGGKHQIKKNRGARGTREKQNWNRQMRRGKSQTNANERHEKTMREGKRDGDRGR